MNRLLFGLVAIVCLATVCDSADACNRCGIFGRGCRFVSHAVQQVVAVAQPVPTTQNFVFNNTFPTAGISSVLGLPAGNTVYGYSLAASAYQLDPAQVLDRSARLTELAINGGRSALGDHNATVQGALALAADADRRANNTVVALSAITANQQSVSGSQAPLAFKVTVANGKITTETIEPGNTQPPSAPPASFSAAAVGGLSACAGCHDGTGKNKTPVGFSLAGDKALTKVEYDSAVAKVFDGSMPPKTAGVLNDSQRAAVIAELAKLIQQ